MEGRVIDVRMSGNELSILGTLLLRNRTRYSWDEYAFDQEDWEAFEAKLETLYQKLSDAADAVEVSE